MEIEAKTLYEVTLDELMVVQQKMLEYKALYAETKFELENLKKDKGIELSD